MFQRRRGGKSGQGGRNESRSYSGAKSGGSFCGRISGLDGREPGGRTGRGGSGIARRLKGGARGGACLIAIGARLFPLFDAFQLTSPIQETTRSVSLVNVT